MQRPGLFITVTIAGALLALASPSTVVAQSQASWMDSVFGNPPGVRTSRPKAQSRPEVLDDLRPGTVPMRDGRMLQALDRAIAKYQGIVARGGWPTIPGSRMMRPLDDDERLPSVRRRLVASGELSANDFSDSYSFDATLERAIKAFQTHHGLRVSGRVDKPTLAAMNVTAQARLDQLMLNRRRIAELMQEPPEDRYVLVNTAGFQLEAVERGVVERRHRVIVGKPARASPSLKATIKALNFFPYWRVPGSVATLDLIPRLRQEPDYLEKERIRVLIDNFNGEEVDPRRIDWNAVDATRIRFRQDPGIRNALGLVRIDMPNEHGVYMHDTPMKQLFAQRGRSFSAGCIRVEGVFRLVEWIARYEPGWENARVESVIDNGEALDVNLWRQIPVYFTYVTAWAEPDGSIEFRPDIYDRDGDRQFAAGREQDPSDPPLPAQTLAP